MVQQIERLCPDLKTLTFDQTEILENREVHADPSGQRTDVAARAAPETRQRIADLKRIYKLDLDADASHKLLEAGDPQTKMAAKRVPKKSKGK